MGVGEGLTTSGEDARFPLITFSISFSAEQGLDGDHEATGIGKKPEQRDVIQNHSSDKL